MTGGATLAEHSSNSYAASSRIGNSASSSVTRRTRTRRRGAASIPPTAPCSPCTRRPPNRSGWPTPPARRSPSPYGGVLALYAKASHSLGLADDACEALDFTLYSIDAEGRPRDVATKPVPGGWQEDAHTDVIHNYVDALRAYPEWGEAR